MASQQFCLKWNNHMVNMAEVFQSLLSSDSFVDVTLACDGLSLKCHKIVLAACSPFFRALLLDNPCQHPIVILKDVRHAELKAIVRFMYHGEVNVAQDQLPSLMKTAENLKIRGLAEIPNEKEAPKNDASRSNKRTESPPAKRKRRNRKRSHSDQSDDDDYNEPRVKQNVCSDVEELCDNSSIPDAPSQKFSSQHSRVPSHSQNSFPKSSASHGPQIEEPSSEDEPEYRTDSNVLDQSIMNEELSVKRTSTPVIDSQRRTRGSSATRVNLATSAETFATNQSQTNSSGGVKVLDLDEPSSPNAEESGDDTMFMDQSSSAAASFQETSTALVPAEADPFSTIYVHGQRIFRCNECGYCTPASTTMRHHINSHSGIRPHGCTVCQKRFTQLSNLKTHLKTHYEKHECQECGMKFNTKNMLKKHTQVHLN